MSNRSDILRRGGAGFTVIEISVVMGIFLVLFLIVMGLIRVERQQGQWSQDRLEGAAGSVQALDYLRFDAERSVCHDPKNQAVQITDGPLRFYVANEKPNGADEQVRYAIEASSQAFLTRNEKLVSQSHFRSVVAKPAPTGAKITQYSTANNGLVNVYMDVGEEQSGIHSRTTTMGVVLLLREENLRPHFYMWNDNTTLVH